jgi:hypothetical protein
MITSLSQLIAEVESADNQYAMRNEPAHKPADEFVSQARTYNACSLDTAHMICATSWGKYQMMGDNLYWLGYKGSVGAFLCNPETQLNFFNLYIAKRKIDYKLMEMLADNTKLLHFATLYNGNGSAYSARMLAIYAQSANS